MNGFHTQTRATIITGNGSGRSEILLDFISYPQHKIISNKLSELKKINLQNVFKK